jgi:hypothetical protein
LIMGSLGTKFWRVVLKVTYEKQKIIANPNH